MFVRVCSMTMLLSGLESSTVISSTSTWLSKKHEYEYMAIEKTRVRVLKVRVRVPKFFKSKNGNFTFSDRSYCFYAVVFCLNSNPDKINGRANQLEQKFIYSYIIKNALN